MADERYTIRQFLDMRGVDEPCSDCGGMGRKSYPNTATWRRGGICGQAFTDDVCDTCWGTGDSHKRGVDLRAQLDGERQRTAERAVELLAQSALCDIKSARPAVSALCAELDKLGSFRARKERPDWFRECCRSLAKRLRLGIGETAADDG